MSAVNKTENADVIGQANKVGAKHKTETSDGFYRNTIVQCTLHELFFSFIPPCKKNTSVQYINYIHVDLSACLFVLFVIKSVW